MRFLVCLSLLLIFDNTLGKLRTMKYCGRNFLDMLEVGRIVGGRYSRHGHYPWMVSLHQEGLHHVCGATIVNENLILSAAHCFDLPLNPNEYHIYVGLHRLPHTNHWAVQKRHIKEIILHEHYDNKTFTNDIAIIRPRRPINLGRSKYVNGICLPKKTDPDPKGYATVIGWGHTEEEGENSDMLQEVTVPIVPRRVCNEAYDDDPTDDIDDVKFSMICAGEASIDSCQNDSGGPLFQMLNGIATLIGIVSHGAGCGQPDFPGIYTRVSSYLDWIEKHA